MVPILLKGDGETGRTQSYLALRDTLRAPGFEVTWTGPSAIISEIVQRSQRDLVRTELMVLPLMMLLMVFVFRGVVAALLPVVTGVLATAAALAALRAVADVIEVPYVTVNLVVAIGLAAGVDAGLLIVSRFREELRAGRTPAEAVAITVDTAGRTVALSGVVMTFIAVGLAFFPLGFVRALGIGAAAGLLVGALVTVTVLPALLFCLGERVDALSPAWLRRQGGRRDGALWGRVARAVMQKPIAYTCAVSALLLALAVPFLHTVIGFPDQRMLPAGAPARVAAERMEHDFAVSGLGTLQAIATFDHPVDRGRGHADLLTWTRNVSELPAPVGCWWPGPPEQGRHLRRPGPAGWRATRRSHWYGPCARCPYPAAAVCWWAARRPSPWTPWTPSTGCCPPGAGLHGGHELRAAHRRLRSLVLPPQGAGDERPVHRRLLRALTWIFQVRTRQPAARRRTDGLRGRAGPHRHAVPPHRGVHGLRAVPAAAHP
ncbi:hypothetical protein GCM10017744_021200 [Streptomyces antimycoticus]